MNEQLEKQKASLAALGLGKEAIFGQLLGQGFKVDEINEAFAPAMPAVPPPPVPGVVAQPEDTQNRTVNILVAIGAVLIGAGIFSFVAANWDGMGSALKMTVILVALLLVNGLAWYLKEQKNYPKAGVALYFLGNLIYGAGIFLTAQIFNIQAGWPDGFMMWMIGTAAMAYVLDQYSLFYLAGLAGFIAIIGQPLLLFDDPLSLHNFALTPLFLLVLCTAAAAFVGISIRRQVPPDQKGYF